MPAKAKVGAKAKAIEPAAAGGPGSRGGRTGFPKLTARVGPAFCESFRRAAEAYKAEGVSSDRLIEAAIGHFFDLPERAIREALGLGPLPRKPASKQSNAAGK